ncbi:class I SAM-dependent methyltransferase [Aquirufa rosea]|uniref:Class I SAM-dependent methyltransferase n=1 Tax=Aquirufa rosea TaxID=2509241 RepID=A0A4Q1BXW4_9BACT|nr:class I SAM-dependent methyltransferase [Aquirufa rosea]RXK47554.1 class I SAM-dependent methyltransferase [Aquirufa rosea]
MKNRDNKLSLPKLVLQIQARQKLAHKLPSWVNNPAIFFPSQLHLEQASSQDTALFKAQLVKGNLLDLTGGMGIDVWAFAQTCSSVTYIERDPQLTQVSSYNHQVLGLNNINHICGDGREYLQKHPEDWDYVYIDPARRGSKGEKVILLEDCEPNVTELLDRINKKTQILIKTSPLLDISRAIESLQGVDKVWIICVKNEVKELLFLKSINSNRDPLIEVHELSDNPSLLFQARLGEEREATATLGHLDQYLYEPHAGILKAGFFKMIAGTAHKLALHTHLYASHEKISHFPGRKFKVLAQGSLDKKWLSEHLTEGKANISTRNFPLSPEEIRKKWKIKEGGPKTLFAFQDMHQKKLVALCEKCDPN